VALGTCLLINEAMADETSGTDESQMATQMTSMAAHEGIEEITVTATRTERPIFTTPFSVSVINASDIELFQPFSYADVFEGTPGLSIQGGARRIAEEPSIRGFSDQQLVLRIDGARQNFDLAHRGRFFVDPDLVQRIEVVRGSASALYGSGALGGVISLETKGADDLLAAGDDLGGRAKLGYQGNGNEFLASGGLFGRSGKIDAFANIIYREVFDDLEDGSGETILDSRDRLLNGLLKLGITPAEHHRIEITAEVFDNDGHNPTAADDISSPSTVVDRDSTEYALRSQYSYADPDHPWLDFGVSAYYQSIDITEDRFIDGRLDQSEFESFGIDLHNTTRLIPARNTKIALTYGFEFFEDSQSGTRNGAARIEFPDAERSFIAGYAQAEIDLFDGILTLVPGIRIDSFAMRPEGNFAKRTETDASPRFSIGIKPTEWLYLWGGWAQAFRAPSLSELFNDGVHFTIPNGLGPNTLVINEFRPTPLLAPEDAESFEAGARIRRRGLFMAKDSFEISGNYFSSDIDDFVDTVVTFIDPAKPPVFTPPLGPITFFGSTTNVNIRARLSGFEGEITYDSPIFSASVSGFTVDGDNRDTGSGLGSIPQDSLTFSLKAKLPRYGWQVGGRASIAAAQNDVPDGSVTTESYETVDLFANWSPQRGVLPAMLEGTVMTIGIDNLFDETFSIHPTVIRQPGRSVRLTLSRQF
jgi:hemoglobin/transferrin/lactoferrin receptor protein